jgi:hypothetical protein
MMVLEDFVNEHRDEMKKFLDKVCTKTAINRGRSRKIKKSFLSESLDELPSKELITQSPRISLNLNLETVKKLEPSSPKRATKLNPTKHQIIIETPKEEYDSAFSCFSVRTISQHC